MDANGLFAAGIIARGVKALAARVVACHAEHDAAAAARIREFFTDQLSATETSLHFLGEALATGCPELFHDHLEWLKVALTARDLPWQALESLLACTSRTLEQALPEPASLVAARTLAGSTGFLRAAPETLPSLLEPVDPLTDLTRRYLLAVLEGGGDDAVQLLLAAADRGTPILALHQVLERAQAEVGRMWQMAEVDVGEEHFATQTARRALTLLHERLPHAAHNGRRLLACSVGGEQHDLGLQMVTAAFTARGWHTIGLGADMPAAGLVRSLRDFDGHVLAISVSLALHVSAAARLIEQVRTALPGAHRPVLAGGRVFRVAPGLWRAIGADATAETPEQAEVLASALVRG